MRKRVICLRGAGREASVALDDTTQGLFFGRHARVMLALGVVLLGMVLGFAACGGDGEDEGEASPTATAKATATPSAAATLTAEEAKDAAAIPDLESPDKSLAEVVSQETLSPDEVQSEVSADAQLADLMAYAQEQGYGSITGGVKTEYGNGVVVTAGALQSPDNALVALVRSSEPHEDYFLARLESADPLKLVVFDQNGEATIDLSGPGPSSADAHGSCKYFHCVAAGIYFLMDDPIYGWIARRACSSCLNALLFGPPTVPIACSACIATVLAPVLASGWVCNDDPCGWCYDDSCGDPPVSRDEYCLPAMGGDSARVTGADTGYQCVGDDLEESECQYSSESIGVVRNCPYGCADIPAGDTRSRDCAAPACTSDADCPAEQVKSGPACTTNPDGAPAAWVRTEYEYYRCEAGQCAPHTRTGEEGCWYGCAADGSSCACEASLQQDVALGDPRCVFRPDDQQWIIERDYRHYYSIPLDGGLNCQSETITKFEEACPNGCAPDGKSCASALPTCDPALCTREEPVGDPRCVLSPSGYIIEQPFQDYSCHDLPTGGSACDWESATEVMENCPYGCAPDGKSCASTSGVPVAPSDFLALENPGGTYFEWTDNSLNEDGFKIYFGARSLGRPSQLITTVGPDTQTVDTDFVRSGTEICWEIYAFNSAGDSAPAWYCLPP